MDHSTRLTEEEYRAMQARVRGGVTSQHTQTARPAGRRNTHPAGGIAGASPTPAPIPSYRSKEEAGYALVLEIMRRCGEIDAWAYEPFPMPLPGGVVYTPDFVVLCRDHLEIHEYKGWSRNRRDGITRLKIAAGLYPWIRWCLVESKDGRFKETWL